MNSKIQKMCSRFESELDSLNTSHSSGRDNGRWIAELKGKLDVCYFLRAMPIDNKSINDARRTFDDKPSCSVEEKYINYYKNGAIAFIRDLTKMLKND